MKISVIIPVYNAERYVRHALDSVLVGAGRLDAVDEVELVCVDDGSTDSSGRILDDFAARDARVRAFHKPNGGEGSARNRGMDEATGDLLAFLDADDRMHPEALRVFCALWRRTRFEVLRYSAQAVGDETAAFAPLDDEPTCEPVDFARCGESPFVFCALGWATVVTRELSRQVRWTGLRQGADMVFVLDCLQKTKATYRTRAQLVNYYLDPNSISRRMSAGLLKGTCDYLPLVLAKADALGIAPEVRRAANRFAAELLLRRMPGVWERLPAEEDRRSVETAFWRSLGELSERDGFLPYFVRTLARQAVCRRSIAWLRLFVILPWRIVRRIAG